LISLLIGHQGNGSGTEVTAHQQVIGHVVIDTTFIALFTVDDVATGEAPNKGMWIGSVRNSVSFQ
jgi:hypothetical protein